MIEHKSGSSTPQRSGSTAGLHRPRLSIDSASVAVEMPQLSSSLPGSLTGSTPLLAPRQGSHTMDFFEMCASLITTLARWDQRGQRTPPSGGLYLLETSQKVKGLRGCELWSSGLLLCRSHSSSQWHTVAPKRFWTLKTQVWVVVLVNQSYQGHQQTTWNAI